MSSPTTGHQDYLSGATNGRQPVSGSYIPSSYGQGESYSPHTSASAQQQYHAGQYPSYVNTSPSSPYNAHSSDRHAGWQPPMSSQNLPRSGSYGHVEASSYSLPGVQRQHSHSHSGTYFPSLGGSPYDSSRAAPAQSYSHSSPTSGRYRTSGGNVLSSPFSSNYSYGTLPPSAGSVAHHPASVPRQPPSPVEVRCEWDRHCRVPLDDTSPSGIARHLRQYHDIAVTDNRNRGVCSWGGRCSKDMFPSSFGKHIAECHLRNMTKQCPHCGADFARADTLSRHIKAFCPHTTGHAGQAYSST
ncbi:hypothetical protein C8Q80DRAFT_1271692 [Daedaleopsis nitida]|nr:hypothetical protein C8Q80DRAFT_1271692 [Daedaleopsis nitida]